MEIKKELTLKEIQEGSFEVLKKVKKIFDENGLKYYLAYGTLIGTVRHEGFIPWDDDIDIWVPRPDYEKFIEYCINNKESIKPLELIHYLVNDKYIYPIARISNSEYYIDYKNVKNYGLGLFVDIYPLDGSNLNDIKLKNKIKRVNKDICLHGQLKYEKSKSVLKTIIKYPYYRFIKSLSMTKLLKKNEILSKKHSFEEEEKCSCVSWSTKEVEFDKKLLMTDEKECFMKFNGELFRVPIGYDEILTKIYGDYMKLPPENERIAHHYYKAYKKQK